ncbi:hypothetical protein DV495_001405 [Geotrichum candidum]|uniref:Similar to Saccharomyces cerevisiae YBR222C PCS60 Peroxisomal protein that binds AMP and mRNA n=1 Tax=Geotrichum candidum TaxID=1173061 RepID=A0A0J9X9T5_GEOCN|nr:hypothetical protein DV452_004303 [Geotrichum candidum]KAI9214160.1 hypothetical protein DS838_000912 [Geotrichum bryndzae]KAF5119032.1 hypothetical protein DV454_000134 [Geotrichum candidum]KAF5132308.1 hypothetical protein DV495_001405 [Geotrichum candidum]KAF7499402.1 hypothetical protein DV113_002529 [Geotrichum candidum]
MSLTRKEAGATIHVSPWSLDRAALFKGNIAQFMLNSFANNTASADKPIYIDALDSTKVITKRNITENLKKIAYILKTRYDIKEGDAVCLMLTNSIYLPILHLGILAAGGVVSPANIMYLPNELHHQLYLSGARVIITQSEFIETARQGAAYTDPEAVNIEHILTLEDLWKEATNSTESLEPIVYPGDSNKDKYAYYCFSSGTSGKPKGVLTTHANIISNVTQQVISTGDNIYKPGNVFGAVLPMSHIYGLSTFIYTLPVLGNSIVVFEKFDFQQVLEKISEHGISVLHIVPPMAVLFAKSPLLAEYPLVRKYIKGIMSGAAPLSKSLGSQLIERLDCQIWQAYGLTETSPINHFPTYDLAGYDVESVGWLMPGLEGRLVDENGQDVHGFNERGELWLRGPNIMRGYIKNAEATAETFSADGQWLRTGDVAIVNETGQWFIVDRFKELIKSKGHQVAPAELESILLSNPDVVDAAVTGIHMPEEGTELPRAFVVLRNATVDPLVVKRWFDSKVARHKKLWGGLVVIDVVPKSSAGKIQRRILRDRKDDVVHGYRQSKL